MTTKAGTFPPLELKMMHILWEMQEASVAQVQERLESPLAYTTVQTILNRLATKGKITRELEGRAFVYRPVVTQAKATGHALNDLIDRIFGGSSEELVMSLLKTRQIDAATLAELSRRYDPESTTERTSKVVRKGGRP